MKISNHPGLYVHVPFCRTKCPYCAFYSIARLSLIPDWLSAVEGEVLFYKDEFEGFDSLYLGGGTPSLLTEEQLGSLLDCLFREFGFHTNSEITIEVNPDDLNLEKLRAYRAFGIDRISVGVQSFNEEDLRYFGRRHTADQTWKVLDWIRSAGFENVGMDLIFGFKAPHVKTPIEHWARNLERALAFTPEHLSCYQMTYEEGTPFGKMQASGAMDCLEKDEEAELFLFTSDFLEGHGYLHYEVSNFAADVSRISRHNTKYWHHVPYLGLGPSAHSFHGGERWWNTRSLRDYCRLISEGEKPISGRETLTPEQLKLEALMLGARTHEGFSLDAILDRSHMEAVLEELRDEGLIVIANGRIVPTREGFLVADSLSLLFS